MTSYDSPSSLDRIPVNWGNTAERGPIVTQIEDMRRANAFGLKGGLWGFTTAISRTSGQTDPNHVPDLSRTNPCIDIPENPRWNDPTELVVMDAIGHRLQQDGVMPTISVTPSGFVNKTIKEAIADGRLTPDGNILVNDEGEYRITEIDIDQTWHIPGVARRLGLDAMDFREELHKMSGGMFPQLVENPELEVFLPPVGGMSIKVFGDLEAYYRGEDMPVTARLHDKCGDGDQGAIRCTCAAYRDFATEKCIQTAQEGGLGVIVECDDEGRGYGAVLKHLVYLKRESHPDGDSEERYFECTRQAAGGIDARQYWGKPDPFFWLLADQNGDVRIDDWVSSSNLKIQPFLDRDATFGNQHSLPKDRIHAASFVEITAKEGSGYYDGKPGNNGQR